jgi:hypothetical protein
VDRADDAGQNADRVGAAGADECPAANGIIWLPRKANEGRLNFQVEMRPVVKRFRSLASWHREVLRHGCRAGCRLRGGQERPAGADPERHPAQVTPGIPIASQILFMAPLPHQAH